MFDRLDIFLHHLLAGLERRRALIFIHGGCLEGSGAVPDLVVGIGKTSVGLQLFEHQRPVNLPDFDVKLHLCLTREGEDIVTHQR